MRRLVHVPHRPILNLEYLASATAVSYEFLTDVVERRIDPYQEFMLAKSTKGTKRTIAAPVPDLAKVQRWILDSMLAGSDPGPHSFAYQKGVSVRDCAEVHLRARWLVKLDLRDFFNSVTSRRVARVFRMTGCDEEVSVQLAQICTRATSGPPACLPQGAPTSGMLANLAAENLDRSLSYLARSAGLKYTRYSDDITFSSISNFTPPKVAALIRAARGHILRNHFVMHEGKIRVHHPGSRLIVMGLLVDTDRVRLSVDFRKRLEWHVYGSRRFGLREYSASKGYVEVEEYLRHVDGLFAHAIDVEPEWALPLRESWKAVSRQRSK